MQKLSLFSLIVGPVVAAGFVGCAPATSANNDLKTMQGTWTLVSGEKDGEPLPEAEIKDSKLTIKGDAYTVQIGDVTVKGIQKLDPTKSPKQIDGNDTEGPSIGMTLGIYEFTPTGDVRVCFAPTGKPRPTDFVTKPDSGHWVHVWHRQKSE